ncbi:MAG: hypothetical protein ACJA1B_002599 [Polaribacter sp.]|jgi:hypothetical protein
MKNMIHYALILSSFLLVSCNTPEQSTQEELTSTTAKTLIEQEQNYLYGIEIYYSSAEIEIKRLDEQKTKLVAEFENGNKAVMEQIENIQKEVEKLKRFNASLLYIKKPIGGKGPMPPRPCFIDNRSNCIPQQNLSSNTVIVLGKELIVTKVFIKNNKNGSAKADFITVKDQFGQSALQLKTNFQGEGIMYTTLKTNAVGEITIPTPIVIL